MATQDPSDDPQRARRADREASVVGSLSDMGVADLVQTLEMGKKSGVLHLHRTGARGTCWLKSGRVVDCELTGAPAGEEAFFRILRWREGGFAIEFRPVEREERIELPTQALLLQGMRRLDEWGRVVEQLPPLDRRLEVDVARLGERLARMPDDANGLLRLFDGRRTLAQVLEAAPRDDVAAADAVARLVADGVLRELPGGAEAPRLEPAAAAAPSPPPPEPGAVDWFAGPVGPPAATAPVTSWVPAPPEPSAAPDAGWLEPPQEPPVAPAPGPAAPSRGVFRFSIPVPPPGSLPPPPSVAETLARYQVVPRPRRAPEQVPAAGQTSTAPVEPAPPVLAPTVSAPVASAPTASAPAISAPAASAPTAPVPSISAPASAQAVGAATAATAAPMERVEPAPTPAPTGVPSQPAIPPEQASALAEPPPSARAEPPAPAPRELPARAPRPVRVQEPPPELVRRLSGTAAARRRDPGSIPVHLEAERLTPPAPVPPRRSALPYLALGAIVLAAIVGGTALTRRPVLRGPEPAPAAPAREPEAAPPQAAPAQPAVASPVQPVTHSAEPAPQPAPERPAPATKAPPEIAAPSPNAAPAVAAAAAPTAPVAPVAPPARAAATAAAEPTRTADAPAAPAASAEPDPRKLLAAADRKYAAGRYADAIADYRRAIAQRSTPTAHVSLARALYDAHRSAEALEELDGVLAESPRDASAWLLRGDIHQGEGRSAEAREAYQRFLELQPNGEQARTVRMILEREQQ